MKRRIVTPEQLQAGWYSFTPDVIPNLVRHEYANPVKRPDGNYEVNEPEDKP